jgi:hypothetical protein
MSVWSYNNPSKGVGGLIILIGGSVSTAMEWARVTWRTGYASRVKIERERAEVGEEVVERLQQLSAGAV